MADLFEALSDADDAGLFYVTDDRPGTGRRQRGKGFSYVDPDGKPVDDDTRAWIASIAIPPAWTDVWICPVRGVHGQGLPDVGRTVVAAETLVELGPPTSAKDADQQVIAAVDAAAENLGNTRQCAAAATCTRRSPRRTSTARCSPRGGRPAARPAAAAVSGRCSRS